MQNSRSKFSANTPKKFGILSVNTEFITLITIFYETSNLLAFDVENVIECIAVVATDPKCKEHFYLCDLTLDLVQYFFYRTAAMAQISRRKWSARRTILCHKS